MYTLSDISLILPSRNNLKYLKWSYESIRQNAGPDPYICIADDASTDGTWNWVIEVMAIDSRVLAIKNEGPNRKGHCILYDEILYELVNTPLAIIWHADMFCFKNTLSNLLKHIKPKTIVSSTRIEPLGLHPPGKEKILFDIGLEPEQFKRESVEALVKTLEEQNKDITTEGVFAPWMFFKSDVVEIGGHDRMNFSPQSREDDDIWNRLSLNGCKFIQSRDSFVAHLTCRGSRFNPTLTLPGKNSSEWEIQNKKSERNFLRKWGKLPHHTEYHNPIIFPKYDIGIVIKNCNENLLHELEPLCSTIYVDCDFNNYIENEQKNTKINLSDKIKKYDSAKNNNIIVEFDFRKLDKNSYPILFYLPDLLKDSGEIGKMEYSIFKFDIKSLEHYETDLVQMK